MPGPLGAGDYLTALVQLGADAASAAELARVFGYRLAPELRASQSAKPTEASKPTAEPSGDEEGDGPDDPGLGESLELPVVFEPNETAVDAGREPEWWSRTKELPAEAPGQAAVRAPPAPLFDPRRQRDILRALVSRRVPGRRIDVDALTAIIARHLPCVRLPVRQELRLARSIAVVAQRSPQLDTFESDVRMLLEQLRLLAGRSAVTYRHVSEVPALLPPAEAVLVTMRGRPRYRGDPSPAVEWFDAARLARATGSLVFALSPESLEREIWKPLRTIEWSRRTTAVHVTKPYGERPRSGRRKMVELARLLSPAVRIEPALLRQMRLTLLPDAGPEVELELRSSRWVLVSNILGFSLRPEIKARLLRRLRRHPDRQRAFQVVEEAHRQSPPVLQLEEKLVRLAHERPASWLEQSEGALREATRALSPARAGLARWVAGAASVLPQQVYETLAFREATIRSAAVLGQQASTQSSSQVVPEVAVFLRERGNATEEIELVAIDPESRPLEAMDLEDVSASAFRSTAKKLNTSLSWLNGLTSRDNLRTFRADLVRRTLEREMGRSKVPVRLLVIESRSTLFLVDKVSAIPGVQARIERPRGISPASIRYDMVIVGNEQTIWRQFLPRARSNPAFLLCVVSDGEPHERNEIQPADGAYVELIDSRLSSRALEEIQSLMAFAGRSASFRLSARRVTKPGTGARLQLPPGGLPELVTHTATSPQVLGSLERPHEMTRANVDLSYRFRRIGTLRAIPDLWIARLYRAACRVLDASGEPRTGCVVNQSYVATSAHAPGKGLALVVGDRVGIDLGGASPVSGTVHRISAGLAVVELQAGAQLTGSLRAVDEPTRTGVAVALVHYAKRGLGHLYWGRVVDDGNGSRTFHLQGPRPPSLAATGLNVLVEGSYAGQIAMLSRQADGDWTGQLIPAEASHFVLEESAEPEGAGQVLEVTEYRHDIFISYGQDGSPELVGRLQEMLEHALGRTVRLFAHEFAAGAQWWRSLEQSLLGSRTMLALIDPSYFRSELNRRAWAVFEARSRLAPCPLLLPALVRAAPTQLPRLKLQVADLRAPHTEAYASALQQLVDALVEGIRGAPEPSLFGSAATQLAQAHERASELDQLLHSLPE